MGNGFGTILATIGIPLAMELVKKLTGRGAPRAGRYVKQDGHGAPRLGVYQLPPPLLEHGNRCAAVVKKKKKNKGQRPAPGAQFPVQKYTGLRNHTVKPKFHKNIPMSNHDLLEWCRYLNIPIKDVLPRDQTLKSHPYNHKQALFIYNLGHLI